MPPDFVRQVIQAGGNVELIAKYPPQFIEEFIKAAVARDVKITVTGDYPPQFVIAWAKLGGKHFTYPPCVREVVASAEMPSR